jgi:hypothetical protein
MKTHPHTPAPGDPDHQQWLDGIVPIQEGARLRSTSVDTLKREYAKGKLELLRVSERRWGIRRRVALMK